MHIEIFDPRQLELLPYLIQYQRKFYLVGGTAIALYLGHRRSLDFDLFCQPPFNKASIYAKLQYCPFKKSKIFDDYNQLHFFINDVKTTFFLYPYPIQHPIKIEKFLSVPTLITLASMKAFALGRRAKWKDYVDLFFILNDYFSIEEICNEANKNFGSLFSEKLFRQQLAFHKDIDFSEPVEYLVPAPSEEEIKQFLIDKAIDIGLEKS